MVYKPTTISGGAHPALIAWWKKRACEHPQWNNRSMMIDGIPVTDPNLYFYQKDSIGTYNKPYS